MFTLKLQSMRGQRWKMRSENLETLLMAVQNLDTQEGSPGLRKAMIKRERGESWRNAVSRTATEGR
jgi:hypothetical protein